MAFSRNTEKIRAKLLASESGALEKTGDCPLEVGLLGLSPYELITGSLGYQNAYRLFNLQDGSRCERLFELGDSWISLESGRAAGAFSVLAASVSYEQELIWLVRALHRFGVPLRAAERGEHDPVVFCGGPVITANPEPAAPFIDVCAIGDGEYLVPGFARCWHATLGGGGSRRDFLERLAGRPGFYVPSLYGGATAEPPVPLTDAAAERVPRAVVPLAGEPVRSTIISSLAHFRSMFMVEIARGCRGRCKFCMVSQVNGPFRAVGLDKLVEVIGKAPPATRSVGLVGANLCDHPRLGEILEAIAARGCRAGVSSLRIGTVDSALLRRLRSCGVHSITLAPESASPRLLRAIGKFYDPARLIELVRRCGEEGFTGVKLYYLIGLPGETDQDRAMLAGQFRELAEAAGGRIKLSLSVNPFVPKPQTAWQDCSMMKTAEVKKVFRELKKTVAAISREIDLSWQSPAQATAQAVLSLGGRELAGAIEKSALEGVRLLDCLAGQQAGLDSLLYQREKLTSAHPWRVLECEPSLVQSPGGG